MYRIQKSTGKLLANMHLQRGEVRRLGQYPVSGTGSMDVWEGIYLNEEKVAIKILRAVHSTPRSLLVCQHKFRSTHLHKHFISGSDAKSTFGIGYGKAIKALTFSRSTGFARMMDRSRASFPSWEQTSLDVCDSYVVSPWHPNGTADKYVAQFPDVDHLALVSL